MKIEDKVLSIEQVIHLKELGLEIKDTMFSWFNASMNGINVHMVDISTHDTPYTIESPTLTSEEMIDILPKKIAFHRKHFNLMVDYRKNEVYYLNSTNIGLRYLFETNINRSLKDSVYQVLCYVLEYRNIKLVHYA